MTQGQMARDHDAHDKSGVQRLAQWALAIKTETIPQAALNQAKALLLDTIGCGIAGRAEHAAQAVCSTLAPTAAAHGCSVIGARGVFDAATAVFGNGVLIRVLDFNDYVIGNVREGGESGGHPSDNIPAALAAGEAARCAGRDILAAIVLGYETFLRGRALIPGGSPWDGVTASGFAVPVMAGRLLGLDEERFAHAIALAAARAPTPAAVRSGHLSAAKSLANALVAQAAMQGTVLAAAGVTGPLKIIEMARGLRPVFPADETVDRLTAPLPDPPGILAANMKAYPCVATAQAMVDAALCLHAAVKGQIDAITSVTVTLADSAMMRRQQQEPARLDPTSRESADHSFTFAAAAALIDGAFGLAQFDNDRWTDPAVRALMGKITLTTSSRWDESAAGSYPCNIEIASANGTRHAREVAYPTGLSRGRLDMSAVEKKFSAITAGHLTAGQRDRIVEAVMGFDAAPDSTALWRAINS
ncbi:MAG TPA: MmgE/PrpD family protein [Xanthobacteraceae bacterium]|jgi:2-methylcitrate dehydratase|nr:MmgE/PrpD family protein [Xanthobacteraceae bacterium]